ncbi:DUF3099 domain-containing protein [Cryobacterium sp. TMT4-31]|uniref:DUF3099 domain-containing protein n=1 Tax=Cryobacterium sp. TMT4-31 TaxID=1259259 RepID=UPI001F5474B7|nr:DUF3099 domain-containing protein [Cryobacterium sp. TMT4-31]
MMKQQQQSITTLPLSPEEERRRRMIRYTVTMGIRMVCIVMMLFVQGWWLVVCALGAILLPYFAVIAANVHGDQRSQTVLRPGAVAVLPRPGATGPDDSSTDDSSTDDSSADDSAPHDSKDPR